MPPDNDFVQPEPSPRQENVPMPVRIGTYIGIALTGASLGSLAGLSASPAIGTVLSVILGVSATAVTAAMGVRDNSREQGYLNVIQLSIAPLSVFVSFVTVGAVSGVWVRSNHWLEPSVQSAVALWNNNDLTREEVARRLLESQYPVAAPVASSRQESQHREESPQAISPYAGVLHAGEKPPEKCHDLFISASL